MAKVDEFNAGDVDPMNDFSPIPAGKYIAVMTQSEWVQTKKGDGEYLNLTWQIVEGKHKGRSLWSRLNLRNKNQLAVQIAQAELSSICRAIGILIVRDTVQLHDIPIVLTVKLSKRSDTGEDTNEIRGYAKRESSVGQEPQAERDVPPWLRNGNNGNNGNNS